MPGTSSEGRRIKHAATIYNAAQAPLDAVAMRDFVANNLLHYADSMAQVRAQFAAVSNAASGGNNYSTPRRTVDRNIFMHMWTSGDFPLSLRANRGSYKLRVRVAGASSNNTNAVKFRVVVCPRAIANSEVNQVADYVYETATTSSSTAAWLTGASQGSAAYSTMVSISPDQISAWTRSLSTITDLSGTPIALPACMVSVSVYGHTVNTGATPQLYNCHVQEWVG